MPLRLREGDTLVQITFVVALGRCIHDAHEFVVVSMLLVEKRCWMLGIEAKGRFKCVLVVGEVVLLLGNIGKENLVTVGQGGAVILVLLGNSPRCLDHLLRPLFVSRFGFASCS